LTRKAGGAGLGLSICKEILKLMNGKLLIESEVGKGSSFHVLVPINPAIAENNITRKEDRF
jgi:signal transduction histidine kinase